MHNNQPHTLQDELNLQRRLIAEQSPNSPYWQQLIRAAAHELIELMGREAYNAWCDAIIPDDEPLNLRKGYGLIVAKTTQVHEAQAASTPAPCGAEIAAQLGIACDLEYA